MRTVWIAILGLLGLVPTAQAGVYHLHRTEPVRPAHLIPAQIFQLRAAAIEPKGKLDPDSQRAVCLAEVAFFEPMLEAGTLTPVDAISLSSAYLRLGKPNESIRLLQKIDPDKEHFLVQANLAGVYQTIGEFELAHRHQQTALDLWPKAWAGWNLNVLEAYREYEQYNLRLLTLRLEEARRGGRGEQGVDALFPGVKFVGDSGKPEAGEISKKMLDRLPKNAGEIVLQLALWQPNDRRLCYLLAELFNAYGKVAPALQLVDSIVGTDRMSFEGILQRRKVFRGGKLAMDKLAQRENRYGLMSELLLIPRPTLGVPVAGDIASSYSALVAPLVVAPLQDQPPQQPEQPQTDAALSAPFSRAPFNFLHVGVSFVFGILVATLLGLQWQQWRKRRRALHVADVESRSRFHGDDGPATEFVRQAPP